MLTSHPSTITIKNLESILNIKIMYILKLFYAKTKCHLKYNAFLQILSQNIFSSYSSNHNKFKHLLSIRYLSKFILLIAIKSKANIMFLIF